MALLYYLILKPISLLPWKALYFLSDILYFICYKVFSYRAKVVFSNLRNSFPDKSEMEIKAIAAKFYHHFFDLVVESIKLFSADSQEIVDRMKVTNPEILDQYFEQDRGIIMCGGHYANWEFATVAFGPQLKHRMSTIYKQLKNEFMERVMVASRGKTGNILVSRQEVKRGFYHKMKDQFKEPLAIIFASDQSPTLDKRTHWTTFLNQETAVATGAEGFAKLKKSVVVWGNNAKIARGRYEVTFEVLTENPRNEPTGRITELHTRALEKQILEQPEYWLWTHKRWKLKRDELTE